MVINNDDNYSTVIDIAIMSKYLIENYPIYYEYFKETEFTWDRTGGDPIKQGNRNPLLYKRIGADGIKTGYLSYEKYDSPYQKIICSYENNIFHLKKAILHMKNIISHMKIVFFM